MSALWKLVAMVARKKIRQQVTLRELPYSSSSAKAVAFMSYVITAIPIASFIGLFFVTDPILKIIFGIFVGIALLRIFWNAHTFKNLEFQANQLLLKLSR